MKRLSIYIRHFYKNMLHGAKTIRLSNLYWLLGLVIILFVGIEVYFYYLTPSPDDREKLIENDLKKAENHFDSIKQSFIRDTRSAGKELCEELKNTNTSISNQDLYNILQGQPEFWGASVNKGDELLLWSGYAQISEIDRLDIRKESITLDIRKNNNVLYLRAEYPLRCTLSDSSKLYFITSRRLQQENALPAGKSSEMSLLKYDVSNYSLPIYFSFFESIPDTNIRYRKISVGAIDSVGAAYTFPQKFQQLNERQLKDRNQARLNWALLSLLFVVSFFYVWSFGRGIWKRKGIQLLCVLALWLGYSLLGGYSVLIDNGTLPRELLQLLETTGFLTLISLVIVPFLISERRIYGFQWYPRTLIFGFIYGFLASYSLQYIIASTYRLVLKTTNRPFDLQILPSIETTLLYLGVGILIAVVFTLLIVIGWFLFNSEEDQLDWIVPSMFIGLIIGLWFAEPFGIINTHFYKFYGLIIVLFVAIILSVYFFYLHPRNIRFISRIRLLVFVCFIVSIISYPIFYQGFFDRMENHLITEVRQLVNERDQKAAKISRTLLRDIEERMRQDASNLELDNKSNWRLQMYLSRSMNQIISPEWNNYDIGSEIVTRDEIPIARYATHVNAFHTIKQVHLPFKQTPMLLDTLYLKSLSQFDRPSTQQFQTFYFGVTPLNIGISMRQQLYLRTYVYQQRPNYNKPLQSVLTDKQYKGWKASIYLAEFINGNSIRHLAPGIHYYYPKYNTLPDYKQEAVAQDTTYFHTVEQDPANYRELIYRPNLSSNHTILANVALPGFRNHLFSYFRYYFVLLALGLVILFIYQFLNRNRLNLWARGERFQNRILDSYIIATLLFLGVLVVITYFIVQRQNVQNAERELLNKLDTINETVESSKQEFDYQYLSQLTTNKEVDATIYQNSRMAVTTTPEIYRQNMLPKILPYNVYEKLHKKDRQQSIETLNFAGQPLMIGYKQLLGPEGQHLGTLAIPTFIKSPKYEEQLLDTTSYLLAFYIIIFGLFIGGAALIARQLTRPLEHFQSGLKRISAGYLDTTIPVTTRDEIGALANAYNLMVYKLKDLQEELAEAERQAAWTEMARQIAHEIKNPLTPMKLNLQHLKRKVMEGNQSNEDIEEYVRQVTDNLVEQIETLNTIASDFSRFAKPIEEEFTEQNLNQILSSITDLYQHDKRIHISADISDEELIVNCAADELKRVFINLVKNSTEALPKGGIVMLRSFKHDGKAIVEVVDNGEGISEQAQSKIFVPNFSTKSSGTGLGLAISKKIIDAHKGEINFASVKGTGTTFTIELPLADEPDTQNFEIPASSV